MKAVVLEKDQLPRMYCTIDSNTALLFFRWFSNQLSVQNPPLVVRDNLLTLSLPDPLLGRLIEAPEQFVLIVPNPVIVFAGILGRRKRQSHDNDE